MRGITSESQSSIASRKHNQWNMERDIPVGTVRNHPFLPEAKQPPPQLRHQKKQWDTSNIPKGSVAARILESNSPRKRSGENIPISPSKLKGSGNFRQTTFTNGVFEFDKSHKEERMDSSASSTRASKTKSGSSSWHNEPKPLTKSQDKKLSKQHSSVAKTVQGREDKTSPRKSWEPSREIPLGAVKGRVSTYLGQVESERKKLNNDPTTSASRNTNNTESDSSAAVSPKDNQIFEAEMTNDDDQWIIPDRNVGNTQVFASNWGEAIPAKSAESDDWETPAREWIRSGETKSGPSPLAEVKKKSMDLEVSLISTQNEPMHDTSMPQFENGNIQKPLDYSPVKTPPYTLAPLPKDHFNSYDVEKERSVKNSKRSEEKAFDVDSSSIFDTFNDDFESFRTTSGMHLINKSKSNIQFQTNDIRNQELLKTPSDAFGFPVSPDNEITESQNNGEIVGGDEFFDMAVPPNESVRPSSDDHSFELNNYSNTTSEGGKKDGPHIVDEVHSVKSDSKKKKKGFFKGLFGRKGKDKEHKEYGKIKQSLKDSKKSNSKLKGNSNSTNYIHSQSNLDKANNFQTQDMARSSKNEKFVRHQVNMTVGMAAIQSKVENYSNNVEFDKSDVERETNTAPFDEKSSEDFKKSSLPSYSSSFKENLDRKFPNIGDIDKIVVSSNVVGDDIFDDLESVEKKSTGDIFLDPELDHLDSNIDSEEDSNEDRPSIHNQKSSLSSLPFPPAPENQKTSRHQLSSSEFAKRVHQSSSDIGRFGSTMNETGEEAEKSLTDKKFSNVEIPVSTKQQKMASKSLDFDLRNKKSERQCDSREVRVEEDTKASNAKRDDPFPPGAEKTQLRIDGSKALRTHDGPGKSGLTLNSQPRRKFLSNATGVGTDEMKRRSESSGKMIFSTKAQEKTPGNRNVVLRGITTKPTSVSQRKSYVYPQQSFQSADNPSLTIPNRYTKSSVFKKVSNVQDTAKQQEGRGGNSLSSAGRRANFPFHSADHGKTNLKFSRAVNIVSRGY